MIADRSSPSRVRCAASRPGRLRADPGDVAVYEGKGMDGRPPAQFFSECARLIRASSSIAGTGLMSVSPPATTRVYCGASPYCLGKASARPDLVLDAFAGWISSDVQDDALASLVDECKLHKRAVSQRPDTELVFKGLGVAKRYCRRDSIGDSFLQRRPRGGHPGAPPGRDAPPPQPRPGWKAQLR